MNYILDAKYSTVRNRLNVGVNRSIQLLEYPHHLQIRL